MKALITISTDNGKSFREVGMTDSKTLEVIRFVRTVKSTRGAKRIAKNRANGRPFRIEIMDNNILIDENGMWFRVLSPLEEEEFRQWARKNYETVDRVKLPVLYHPVIRDEIAKLDQRRK